MIKVRLLPQWLNIKADNSWRNKHKTKQMTRDLVHFTAPHTAPWCNTLRIEQFKTSSVKIYENLKHSV